MRRPLLVFIGGGLGACLRAAIAEWLAALNNTLPGPILLINLVGAFFLGLIALLPSSSGRLTPDVRLFLGVGVLGGFTTFSTFAWGSDLLLAHPAHWGAAAFYVSTSVVGGLVSAELGLTVGRALSAPKERDARE